MQRLRHFSPAVQVQHVYHLIIIITNRIKKSFHDKNIMYGI